MGTSLTGICESLIEHPTNEDVILLFIVEPFQANTSTQSPMSSMARGGTCGGLVAGSVGASVVDSSLS